jgi:ATP-dependent RNA helicase DDX46/PRP5
MDDTDTSSRKLQKLALPPVDPLMLPGSSVPGGTVTENLDVVDDDDDDAMDVDKPEVTNAANAGEDEEEEDPLDAFMKENTKEVKKVDAEDEKRFGKSAATVREEVLNLDDDEADPEEEEMPANNGVLSSEEILA